MRTLSTRLTTETAKPVTKPFFLVQIAWSTDVVSYMSTRQTVDYNGTTWLGDAVRVEELRTLAGAAMEGRISLPNTDNAASAYALNEDLSINEVEILTLYGEAPFSAGDAETVFTGVLDGCLIGPDRVYFDIATAGRKREYGPRVILMPPLCNHLPPNGLRLSWGGEIIELEGRE